MCRIARNVYWSAAVANTSNCHTFVIVVDILAHQSPEGCVV